ncbi:MAG: polysaccharide deacetylase family protein [Phyllobacteriaceae bacterium]|nr:polysaccharide deacetylase family protein [Phyllobacteriaceae bacterium]
MSSSAPRLAVTAFLAALLAAASARAETPAPVAPAAPPPAATTAAPRPWSPAEKLIHKGSPAAHVPVPDVSALPPATPLPAALTGSVRRVELPPGEKFVALTFDLCETGNEVAGYDGAIVDTLRRRGVAATFFVGGHWATTHPERYGELARDPRFEVENHTWTHANLRTVDDARLAREILAPEAAFRAAGRNTGSRFLRFPFGACDERSMKAVNAAGMAAIQWDVSTGDPSPFATAHDIVGDTLAGVRPGSIVLAHANGRGFHTGEALPEILDRLEAKGYRFVTVGDLLAKGKPVVTPTCYDAKPGDTDKYDHWTGPGGHTPSKAPLPAPAKPFGAAPTAPAPQELRP